MSVLVTELPSMLLILLNGLSFFWATVSIGGIACGLNGWWNGKEAIKALNAASPKLLVGDEKRISRLHLMIIHKLYLRS